MVSGQAAHNYLLVGKLEYIPAMFEELNQQYPAVQKILERKLIMTEWALSLDVNRRNCTKRVKAFTDNTSIFPLTNILVKP